MRDETNEAAEAEAPAFDAAAHAEQLAVEAGKLIRCKSWGKGQGDYVLVDADAFDPDFHVALDPLDHDGDGRKGGSMPDAIEQPAAELVAEEAATAETKPAPVTKGGPRNKRGARR